MNRVLGLVMKHYNGVARTLNKRPDCYGPLFAVDERHNDILWELRIVGFEKAVKPRPAAWQRLLTADTETALRFRQKIQEMLRSQLTHGHRISAHPRNESHAHPGAVSLMVLNCVRGHF
jgi:yecA family protein